MILNGKAIEGESMRGARDPPQRRHPADVSPYEEGCCLARVRG